MAWLVAYLHMQTCTTLSMLATGPPTVCWRLALHLLAPASSTSIRKGGNRGGIFLLFDVDGEEEVDAEEGELPLDQLQNERAIKLLLIN